MLKFTVTSLTGLLLLAGCNSAPPAPATHAVDIAGEQGKIRDLESAWVAAAAAKDLDKIMTYYADDAILITPGAPAAKSRDAIRRALKGLLADPKIKLAFSSERVAISTSGDMGLLTVPIP